MLDLEADLVEDKLVASESGRKAHSPRRRAVVVLRVWPAPCACLCFLPSQPFCPPATFKRLLLNTQTNAQPKETTVISPGRVWAAALDSGKGL